MNYPQYDPNSLMASLMQWSQPAQMPQIQPMSLDVNPMAGWGIPNLGMQQNIDASMPVGAAALAGGGGMGGGGWLEGLGGFMKGAMGTKDSPGWGGTALGAAGGLAQAFMGMKQYGLAKDKLNESKRQYEQDYAANRGLTNARLEDRQRARLASNSGAYESVGSYMNRYGVK